MPLLLSDEALADWIRVDFFTGPDVLGAIDGGEADGVGGGEGRVAGGFCFALVEASRLPLLAVSHVYLGFAEIDRLIL